MQPNEQHSVRVLAVALLADPLLLDRAYLRLRKFPVTGQQFPLIATQILNDK